MVDKTEDAEIVDEGEAENKPSAKETGIRLLFVILFAAIYSVAELVIVAVVIIQFGFSFISGGTNSKLLSFSGNLNRYVYAILQFVSFRDDDKPFPFSDWPSEQDPVPVEAGTS